MIAAHLQTVNVGHHDITLKGSIDAVTTLGSLQIDVARLGIVGQRIPEHVALIVTHIYAVNVRTRVFTQYAIVVDDFLHHHTLGLHHLLGSLCLAGTALLFRCCINIVNGDKGNAYCHQ